MIRKILRWLFPNPLDEIRKRDEAQREKIRRITSSPEWKRQSEAAARIVEMHREEARRSGHSSGGGSSGRSRSSSSSRGGGSCGGFDD